VATASNDRVYSLRGNSVNVLVSLVPIKYDTLLINSEPTISGVALIESSKSVQHCCIVSVLFANDELL
jgi:hypothetical protein